jgi:hypothetical protein
MNEPNSRLSNAGTRLGGVHPLAWAAIAICIFGLCLRISNATGDLSTPYPDENDIVDQAVAFMGGDWHFHLLEYGPLPMYLLACVYHGLAFVHGLSPLDYAARVFFDAEEQYFVGRLFCVLSFAVLAVCCQRVLAPRLGRWTAGISAVLLALPTLDILTESRVRIDVMQGAFQIGAVLCLVMALGSRQLRHWVLAGVCAGFAIACKPMPGLLVLPCFLAASWFAADSDESTAESASHRRGGLGRRCWDTLSHPGLWLASSSALVASIIGNPSSLDIARFIDGQRHAISKYSGPNAPGTHLNALAALMPLGLGFLLLAGASLLASLFFRDARTRLIALFPLVYCVAFWGRPVRHYYVVAPAMGLCLVIAVVAGRLLERLGRIEQSRARKIAQAALLALLLGINIPPVHELALIARKVSGATLARNWIQANIPSGTKIFHFGVFERGPRLVASDPSVQANWADYFEYGRNKYAFLKQAFRLAHADYVKAHRPVYDLETTDFRAEPLQAKTTPAWLSRSLDRHARARRQEYIVMARLGSYDPVLELGYPWFKNVELVKEFDYVAIFRVPPLPARNADLSAAEMRAGAASK